MQKGIYTQYVQSDNWKVLDILYDPPGIWYMQYFNLSGVFHIIIKHLPQSESGGFMWCPFVCLFVYSFDCRVCCWPQFSWATCTTGLPDVYSPPVKNFSSPCEIYACSRGLLVVCINAPHRSFSIAYSAYLLMCLCVVLHCTLHHRCVPVYCRYSRHRFSHTSKMLLSHLTLFQ